MCFCQKSFPLKARFNARVIGKRGFALNAWVHAISLELRQRKNIDTRQVQHCLYQYYFNALKNVIDKRSEFERTGHLTPVIRGFKYKMMILSERAWDWNKTDSWRYISIGEEIYLNFVARRRFASVFTSFLPKAVFFYDHGRLPLKPEWLFWFW